MVDGKFISSEIRDPLTSLLDAVRSDFADATSPALVRDVSLAFQIIAMQQEALVSIAEILAKIDLDQATAQRLSYVTDLLAHASDAFHENLNSVYGTHLDAQDIAR